MKLFEPIRLGTMALKNRIVFFPVLTKYATEDDDEPVKHSEAQRGSVPAKKYPVSPGIHVRNQQERLSGITGIGNN